MSLKEYYSNLLIIQYHDKPKAKATVEALLERNLDDDIFTQIRDAFDLQTSVGVQLDTIGKYIGVNRQYKGENLSDGDYRIILQLKAIRNTSNHSFYDIANSLNDFFPGQILVSNNYNMTNTFFVTEDFEDIVKIALDMDVLPVPMAVGVKIILIREVPFFAFATYDHPNVNGNVEGFSDYTNFATKDGQFLEYDNFITL